MDASVWLVVIAGAVVAGFVQGLSGFAFSMVSTSIWIWWLPPQQIVVMAVFGALLGQVVAAVTTRRPLQWRLLGPMVIGGLCGLPIGIGLLPYLSREAFQLGVGLLLAVWCPLMLASKRLPRITVGGRWGDALAGLGGGLSGAFGGFTGALPTLWCTLRGWDKDTQRGVIQNFNLALLAVTFASYLATGLVKPAIWPKLMVVAPALLVPVLLGARLYAGLSADAFRRVVLTLLTLTGVSLLLKAGPALLR